MVSHNRLIGMVKLLFAGDDMNSPSQFLLAVSKIPGVREAFRVTGRYDAVVIIHSEAPNEGENEKVLLEVQKIKNVSRVDVLTAYPTGHEKPRLPPKAKRDVKRTR